ncbi:2-aminoethylphosphonate--pyruvate transaminase [Roseobacter sp.]|uniref:2-aminoethylphosphonate--pyruvate transaminase n=1 Tax=Roseobacter sp. TaxID=1907202 RepID=UPI00385C83C8
MTEKRHATYLLTPGPLTTSVEVKAAMQYDKSPNGPELIALVKSIRDYVVELSHGGDTYDCVPIQGSATYGIEAGFNSLVDKETAHVLVVENGFYGLRLREVIEANGYRVTRLEGAVSPPVSGADVAQRLAADPSITHVAVCHCDTGTGILNPIEDIAEACRTHGAKLMIDAIAAYGGFEINAPALDVEAVFISPNKCFEAVPGMALVLAKKESLREGIGRAQSSVLDLSAQWAFMEEKGCFRTTPPTHVLLAIAKAMELHKAEGGIAPRQARYVRNWRRLVDGLRQHGFATFLPDEHASPIIATFHDPDDPSYSFEAFYTAMERRGFLIFPGRLTSAHTFRIGTMGDLTEADMTLILNAVMESMTEIGVTSFTPKTERIIAA